MVQTPLVRGRFLSASAGMGQVGIAVFNLDPVDSGGDDVTLVVIVQVPVAAGITVVPPAVRNTIDVFSFVGIGFFYPEERHFHRAGKYIIEWIVRRGGIDRILNTLDGAIQVLLAVEQDRAGEIVSFD